MTDEPHPLVVLIRRDPGMAARILGRHVDDGAGRCRECTRTSGPGRASWPCVLRHYAVLACAGPP